MPPFKLGVLLGESAALRHGHTNDAVDFIVLRHTWVDPPRVAAAKRLREQVLAVHPRATIVPYVWRLVTHGDPEGSPGTRSIAGEPHNFGGLQPTNEVGQALHVTRLLAEALSSPLAVLATPSSLTPGPLGREALAGFVRRHQNPALSFAWEPEGLWSREQVLDTANQLGLIPVLPAFAEGELQAAPAGTWLRVDVIGRRGTLDADQVYELAELAADGVVLLFAGPRGYANLRAVAQAMT